MNSLSVCFGECGKKIINKKNSDITQSLPLRYSASLVIKSTKTAICSLRENTLYYYNVIQLAALNYNVGKVFVCSRISIEKEGTILQYYTDTTLNGLQSHIIFSMLSSNLIYVSSLLKCASTHSPDLQGVSGWVHPSSTMTAPQMVSCHYGHLPKFSNDQSTVGPLPSCILLHMYCAHPVAPCTLHPSWGRHSKNRFISELESDSKRCLKWK
jgi:hypothetical protein